MTFRFVRSRRTALAGALALGPFLIATSQGNATAIAYSALEVENASINAGVFGGFDDFEFTSFPLSATLNATTVNSPSTLVSNDPGGTTNQSQLTLGDAGFAADNSYFGADAPTYEGQGDFAVADSHQSDTRLALGTGNFGTQAGAQVAGGIDGNADTGTSNSMSWVFDVADDDFTNGQLALLFTFDTTRIFYAETNEAGDTARATLDFSLELFDAEGNLVDSETIFELVTNIQSSPAAFGSINSIDQAFARDLILTSPGQYTLNLLYDSSVQVASAPPPQEVPEPGTVAMLGLGLLGMGVAYRRRPRR